MEEKIRNLLRALDETLATIAKPGERLNLYHIGRSAVIFHYGLPGTFTADLDVVSMRTDLEFQALSLFGKGTEQAHAVGIYLEAVPQGLPPVPQWFCSRCQEVPGDWKVIRLWKPEVHDLAATKLKSFRTQDRQDIHYLCTAGLLTAEKLRASLESAFLWTMEKDGDPDRDRAFANLDKVITFLKGRSTSF